MQTWLKQLNTLTVLTHKFNKYPNIFQCYKLGWWYSGSFTKGWEKWTPSSDLWQPRMAVRYGTPQFLLRSTVRWYGTPYLYWYRYGTLYGTRYLYWYGYGTLYVTLFFCNSTGTVRLFCNGTGTVRWYAVWICQLNILWNVRPSMKIRATVPRVHIV